MVTKTKRRRKRTTLRRGATGRKFTAKFYTPTLEESDETIEALNEFASERGLEPITVTDRKPVGKRWRTEVVTHNWNPLKWIKEKAKEKWEERKARKEEEKEAKGERQRLERKEELRRRALPESVRRAEREVESFEELQAKARIAEEKKRLEEAKRSPEEFEEYDEGTGKTKRTYRRRKKGGAGRIIGRVAGAAAGVRKAIIPEVGLKLYQIGPGVGGKKGVTPQLGLFDVSHMRTLTTPRFGGVPTGPSPTGGNGTMARLRELTKLKKGNGR